VAFPGILHASSMALKTVGMELPVVPLGCLMSNFPHHTANSTRAKAGLALGPLKRAWPSAVTGGRKGETGHREGRERHLGSS
jgi:hypothetical protein